MPAVAQIAGRMRIEQYYGDHHPPHFHATQGGDEALNPLRASVLVQKFV
jgi:hypothetical protein